MDGDLLYFSQDFLRTERLAIHFVEADGVDDVMLPDPAGELAGVVEFRDNHFMDGLEKILESLVRERTQDLGVQGLHLDALGLRQADGFADNTLGRAPANNADLRVRRTVTIDQGGV